jgi:membrane associated rhomboid family serine protease
MGIYDRDYYRDSSGRWWADFGGRSATFWLVLVTCGVFVLQLMTGDRLAEWGAFHYPSILNGQVWRLITPHFLHSTSTLWHIALNMLILYWVGRELEGVYGPREFLAFYLAAALIVSLGMLALGLAGFNPGRGIGASGPVTAAFVLFACHYPYRTIYLFFVIPVPAWLLAVGVVAMDLLGFLGAGNTGVGYSAHLLGAAFAFAYHRLNWRVTGWIDRLTGWASGSGRRRSPPPRLYVETDEPSEAVGARASGATASATESRSARSVDEQLEAKLDHVLEKVSRYGRESLTPEEREILLQASEIYKRRRGQ